MNLRVNIKNDFMKILFTLNFTVFIRFLDILVIFFVKTIDKNENDHSKYQHSKIATYKIAG